jgi:hypothetical protein
MAKSLWGATLPKDKTVERQSIMQLRGAKLTSLRLPGGQPQLGETFFQPRATNLR